MLAGWPIKGCPCSGLLPLPRYSMSATDGLDVSDGFDVVAETVAERKEHPYRNWIFVVNNYTPEDVERVKALVPLAARLAVGYEVGKKKGTPHLQGYVRFIASRRFSWVREHISPERVRLFRRKGTERQASRYSLKDGNVLIDHGVDAHHGDVKYADRNSEADAVIEEIEKDEKYGAIRNRHKRFVFWNRRCVVACMWDHKRLKADPDYCPPDPDSRI